MRMPTLPVESLAALDLIARSQSSVIDDAEAMLGITLLPETRERLRGFCFEHETAEAARAVRSKVNYCPN
jgi:hypothetical protein